MARSREWMEAGRAVGPVCDYYYYCCYCGGGGGEGRLRAGYGQPYVNWNMTYEGLIQPIKMTGSWMT